MVGLVRDVFVVVEQIVEHATHDSRMTQQKMVGEKGGTKNGVPLQSQILGAFKTPN